MLPGVTAIIPNYNHARFLRRRLDSVYRQTHQPAAVILLDDCSTDGSRQILEDYRCHPLTQALVINEYNCGTPFLQWQRGIEMAKTEWIWIAESDDWCELNFLECLLPAAEKPDCVMAFAELTWVDEAGHTIFPAVPKTPQWFNGPEFVRECLFWSNRLQNAGMLIFRKSAWQLSDTRWTEFRQAGDLWLWTEIARQGRIYGCGEPLCFFTRHTASVSAVHGYSRIEQHETLRVYEQMESRKLIGHIDLQQRIKSQAIMLNSQYKTIGEDRLSMLLQECEQFALSNNLNWRGLAWRLEGMKRYWMQLNRLRMKRLLRLIGLHGGN